MTGHPVRLLVETFRQSFWYAFGVAALATLPIEILSQAMGWDLVHPGPYLAEAAWLPVMMLCQLALLRSMGKILNPAAQMQTLRGRVLASAMGAEFLLGLRLCVVILLCALPALFVLAIFGFESLSSRIVIGALAMAACVPIFTYALRRFFASPVVLWQGLKASAALDESARLSRGKLKKVILPLLAMNGIALILEGISGEFGPFSALLMPLSFLISASATAWAYRILTL